MIRINKKTISILLYILLVVIDSSWAASLEREDAANVCSTSGCTEAAKSIQANLDESIDPCNDFYQFACGGWQEKHPIPGDKSSVNTISGAQADLHKKLKTLLEKPLTGSEPNFVKFVNIMYKSCLDVQTIENLGETPLKKEIGALGGWPVVAGSNWDESKFDVVDTLIKLRNSGHSHGSLFSLYATMDFKNNTRNTLEMDQPSLGMPDRSYYLEGLSNNVSSAYLEYMINVATKLGADEATARTELLKVFQFEVELAKISLAKEDRRDFSKLYNKFTVNELQTLAPKINWLKLINGLLSPVHITVTGNEPVIVGVPSYMEKLSKLIETTDKRIMANYLVWRMIKESMSYLSKEWRDLSQDYTTALTGKSKETPRQERCLNALKGKLAVALGASYIRNYFQEESRAAALKMVGYLMKEFVHILRTVDWMEEDTRQKAIEKANAMIPYIGYPDELQNDTIVSKLYENLSLEENSFFDNTMRLYKSETDGSFSDLRKINGKGSQWELVASEVANVDAFNNLVENSIVFPAGILQNAFFNRDRPNYLNFGAIGYVIGHEITHGFDDSGKQFDKNGNNVIWWDPETDQHFQDKVQCIIDQYSNYTVPEIGMNVNGLNTQGENVADNGGLRESYRAYKSWVADNGEEPRLPGLKYTPGQLFWISAANVWCANFTPAALKLSILTDPHSPEKFRIIGALSNNEDFAKDFKCSLGSPMNPEKKCRVW